MHHDTLIALGELWKEALGLDDVPGPDADFHDLGGTSVKATRLIQLVEQRFGRRLAMVELFLAPSLSEMAEKLNAPADAAKTAPRDIEATAAGATEESKISATLRQLIKDWEGARSSPDGLVVGRNTDAAGVPLVWVFNQLADFERLMKVVPRTQPVYAIRSNARMDFEDEASLQILARLYLEEIESVLPEGPLIIGGNCAGSAVALTIAQHLQRRRRHVPVLILMEWWNELQPYAGRVSLLFGRDSTLANPWKYFDRPEAAWERYFAEYETHVIAGIHGQLFEDDKIDGLWAAVAASIANARDLPPYLLPDDARQAALHAVIAPVALVAGQAVPVEVEVTNTSPVTWPDGASSGLVLIGQWRDQASEAALAPARRVALPSLAPGASAIVQIDLGPVDRPGPAIASFEIAEEGFATLLWKPFMLEAPVTLAEPSGGQPVDAAFAPQAVPATTRAQAKPPIVVSDADAAADRAHRAFSRGDALGAVAEASELIGSADSVLLDYADALLQSGDTDAALCRYRQAQIAAPRDPRVLAGLGQALLTAGEPVGARKALESALDASPSKPVDLVQQCLEAIKQSYEPKAVAPSLSKAARALRLVPAALQRARQRDAVVALFENLPQTTRDKRLILRMELDEMLSARRFAKLEQAAARYAKLFPALPAPLANAVERLLRMKQEKTAKKIAALVEHGSGSVYSSLLIKCYLASFKDDAPQLVALWNEIVSLNEQRRLDVINGPLKACMVIGQNLARLGAVDEAIEVAQAGIGMLPSDAGPKALLGRLLLQRGETAEAERAFRDALTVAEKPERIWTAWADAALQHLGPEAAATVCDEALSHLPQPDGLAAVRTRLLKAG